MSELAQLEARRIPAPRTPDGDRPTTGRPGGDPREGPTAVRVLDSTPFPPSGELALQCGLTCSGVRISQIEGADPISARSDGAPALH
jgi:hypothetical protein